jgi:glycosyltransferase involved in cell wall biosynthesis
VDRFAYELLRAWWPLYAEGRSMAVAMPKRDASTEERDLNDLGPGIRTTYGHLKGHLWEQVELPLHSGDGVLLNLCNSGPIALQRQVAVLHDVGVLATPASYSFAYRTWHRFLISALMKRAGVIATVSKFSADDITHFFGKRKQGIELIYEGGEHILREKADPRVLERLNLQDQGYVLVVGSLSPNKNLLNVVRAAELIQDLGVAIVAAGGSNTRVFADVPGGIGRLVSAGYVSNGELRALYESAACFLFPSFYEGFGLPPLEAMHCGCPVVVSNRASMPEICGDAAVYCEPSDPTDIAKQLRRVLESDSLRQEMREHGYLRAQQFSWTLAAKQLEEILSFNFARHSL